MGSIKILSASAGSGKTYRLAYKYVHTVISNPELYKHILAVTFTNKATDEMKRRILKELDTLARGGDESAYMVQLRHDLPELSEQEIHNRAMLVRSSILHDYSHFAVMTIDKFFQRIVRSFMKELGVDMNFNIELKTDDLLSSATDSLIEQMSVDKDLQSSVDAFVNERISSNRQWDLRRDLAQFGKQLFNEGYYASGADKNAKEDIVKNRQKLYNELKNLHNRLHDLADEALSVISRAGLTPTSFKGLSRSFAVYFTKIKDSTGDIPAPSANAIKALDSQNEWTTKQNESKVLVVYDSLNPILGQILECYSRYNTLNVLLKNFDNLVLLTDLARSVDQLCSEQNLLPISNTSRLISSLLSETDTPFIYEKAGTWFDYYMIDEFQDTSAKQWENFVPLIKDSISRIDAESVLLVGDVKQSIYRWRGGDWRILACGVADEFKSIADSVHTETMLDNYRSERRVVEFNNAFIESLKMQAVADVEHKLNESPDKQELTAMIDEAYSSYRQNYKKADGGYVTVRTFAAENPPLAEEIQRLEDSGFRASDIAIMVRKHQDGLSAANILLSYKAQHPDTKYCFDVMTEEALRIDASSVCCFIIACMKLSQNIADSVSLAVVNRFTGRSFEEPLSDTDLKFFGFVSGLSPETAFEKIVMRYKLNERIDSLSYIQAFHQQILSFTKTSVADIALFVEWWEDKGCLESLSLQKNSESITITTIHKAKGLQYKVVIMPFLDWRPSNQSAQIWINDTDTENMPIPITLDTDVLATKFAKYYNTEVVMREIDFLNEMYVAVTRAESELHLMLPVKQSTIISKSLFAAVFCGMEHTDIGSNLKITDLGNDEQLLEYGKPHKAYAHIAEQTVSEPLDSYPTYDVAARVKLHFPRKRFADDGYKMTLAPRDMGVMMHRVFENSGTKADVLKAVERLSADGLLSVAERDLLNAKLRKAFERPETDSWFSADWQVRNENDIIVPHGTDIRRPDRVMIRDSHAVVVDYKFGKPVAEHRKQISDYARLLTDMGYGNVEGYLWYVIDDKIEKVV